MVIINLVNATSVMYGKTELVYVMKLARSGIFSILIIPVTLVKWKAKRRLGLFLTQVAQIVWQLIYLRSLKNGEDMGRIYLN